MLVYQRVCGEVSGGLSGQRPGQESMAGNG